MYIQWQNKYTLWLLVHSGVGPWIYFNNIMSEHDWYINGLLCGLQ